MKLQTNFSNFATSSLEQLHYILHTLTIPESLRQKSEPLSASITPKDYTNYTNYANYTICSITPITPKDSSMFEIKIEQQLRQTILYKQNSYYQLIATITPS